MFDSYSIIGQLCGKREAHLSDIVDIIEDAPGHLTNVGHAAALPADRSVRRIQSVDRALTLIEILAEAPDALSLGEIAERAGINASTCHHLIATLAARGYVLNAGRSRGYLLSSRLQELTEMSARKADLSDVFRADLVALSAELGLPVQLAEMEGTALVTRCKANEGGARVREADEVMKMRAAHATATGKAILAWLPEAEMLKVISEHGLDRFTARTITSVSDLMEDLRHVRRTGYALDVEELRPGVVCCGAALRDEKGAVVGSVSASFPAEHNTESYRTEICQAIASAARRMSDQLRLRRF